MQNQLDVVIIGAGLSGLAAGWELRKEGKSFAILEARERVGGRIQTVSYHGSTIDLGAQWISPLQPRIQALLKYFNIKTTPTFKDGHSLYHMLGKRKITSKEVPPISPRSLFDLFFMERTVNKLINLMNKDSLFSSQLLDKYDAMTMENWIDRQMSSKTGKAIYRLIAEEAACSELSEVSVMDILWCIQSAGGFKNIFTAEDQWIEGGAQALPLRMAEVMADSIHTNHPVRKIIWKKLEACVHSDTKCWNAKRVIIAMPPTFSAKIQYNPPLPAMREQLCQRVGQGSIIKCILIYSDPFWRKNGSSGISYFDQGPILTTMDSSIPGKSNGILTAMIGGKHARRLGQAKPELRKIEILECASNLFGKQALEPIAYFEKDWSSDPWSGGGYAAHFAPGVLSAFGPALFQPVGPIHWAGTETSKEWRLYMEGAIESGQRAAKEVIASIK